MRKPRLHYQILEGTGPDEGWISLELNRKALVEKVGISSDATMKPDSTAVFQQQLARSLSELDAWLAELSDIGDTASQCLETLQQSAGNDAASFQAAQEETASPRQQIVEKDAEQQQLKNDASNNFNIATDFKAHAQKNDW